MADDTPPSETPAQRRLTTDPERIREWAEARDAVPIRVRDGEGHGHSFARRDEMGEHHEEVTWDEFVERFEDDDLVFAYHEEEPTGEGMGFFELVERDRAFERADLGRDELEDSLRRGETVTTEIVETQVVETEVVERDTIESEVIDTELVEREVVDSERLSRDIVDTEFVADDTIEVAVDETRSIRSRRSNATSSRAASSISTSNRTRRWNATSSKRTSNSRVSSARSSRATSSGRA